MVEYIIAKYQKPRSKVLTDVGWDREFCKRNSDGYHGLIMTVSPYINMVTLLTLSLKHY